jgi:hypothetical protein
MVTLSSTISEQSIHYPAALHMVSLGSAVSEDLSVITTCFSEGEAQSRHAIEGSILVNRSDERDHIGSEPSRVDCHGPEGVAENFPSARQLVRDAGEIVEDRKGPLGSDPGSGG